MTPGRESHEDVDETPVNTVDDTQKWVALVGAVIAAITSAWNP
jgi:hypothetical protein